VFALDVFTRHVCGFRADTQVCPYGGLWYSPDTGSPCRGGPTCSPWMCLPGAFAGLGQTHRSAPYGGLWYSPDTGSPCRGEPTCSPWMCLPGMFAGLGQTRRSAPTEDYGFAVADAGSPCRGGPTCPPWMCLPGMFAGLGQTLSGQTVRQLKVGRISATGSVVRGRHSPSIPSGSLHGQTCIQSLIPTLEEWREAPGWSAQTS